MADITDLRIAVPLPPSAWFGGHDREIALAGIGVFRELGATVSTVSADEWADPARREGVIAELERFAPHVVVGIPNAGYGLYFNDDADGAPVNLFTDRLGVPLVLLWDHLLTQSPNYFLRDRFAEHPLRGGALGELRARLANPLNRHYVPDSAHVAIYSDLGIIAANQTQPYLPAAMDHFVAAGNRHPVASVRRRVGFAGNVYAAQSEKLEILQVPAIRSIDHAVLSYKREHWDEAGWNLLCQAVDQLPDEAVYELGLTPDYPYFWKVAMDLLSYRVNTAHRLNVLSAIAHPVDFYGNFAEAGGAEALATSGNITYRGRADYQTELPAVYGSYEVWVDVTNAPFIRGCGAKVLNCFAAGSLMLTDYRADLRADVGELAERFMFRTADELNAKIQYFFDYPRERLEVVEAMQQLIRERLTWAHLSARVCLDIASAT